MFWYLATPYTAYPGTREEAFRFAGERLAVLLDHGVPAFSPIVHTHPVEAEIGLVKPHDFWMGVDRPFMRVAHGLIVATALGWETSAGIREEIETFKRARKSIVFWHPGHTLNYAELRAEVLGKEAA